MLRIFFYILPFFLLLCASDSYAQKCAKPSIGETAKAGVYLQKGVDAEKSGDFSGAFLFYRAAGNACSKEAIRAKAASSLKDLGKRLGRRAEDNGNIFSSGIYRPITDESCESALKKGEEPLPGCMGAERIVLKDDAGAFDIYEETSNHRKADFIIVKYAEARPYDYNILKKAVLLLRSRQKEKGYLPYPELMGRLKTIALENSNKAFAAEEAQYNRKEFDLQGTYLDRSIAELRQAKVWHSLFEGPLKERIREKASERGAQAQKPGDDPVFLKAAASYYELADDKAGSKAIALKADKLGAKAAAAGDYGLALEYYRISDNSKKIAELSPVIKELEAETEGVRLKAYRNIKAEEEKQNPFEKEAEEIKKLGSN